jgi:hypothetical protein
MRSAILAFVAGLMLGIPLAGDASAQASYRYREWAPEWRYEGTYWRAQSIVRQAYRDVLLREPDAYGLRQYTDAILRRGWSELDVRRSLARSPEYARRFGGWRAPRYR